MNAEEIIAAVRAECRIGGRPAREFDRLEQEAGLEEALSGEEYTALATAVVTNLEDRVCALEALELGHAR